MRIFTWILVILITCFGCKEDQNEKYAYLGGQIINPRNNFVVLSKNEEVLDTVLLDGYNRFLYKIDSLQEGMYTFKHGDEFQMVLLEPKDSVLLRLNTLDFDESLVYTGLGAKKNNYFTNEFLQNEIEEKKVWKYCQLDPKSYEQRIESIKTKKTDQLKAFQSKHPTSEYFNKIAQANIDYNYYFNKEIYPFVHYGKNKHDILESLPSDFYSYRKKINYNDDMLKDYFTYISFLRTHISNLGLQKHVKHSKDNFMADYSCYTLDKLNFIDSLITNKAIKQSLLHYYTINALTKSKSIEDRESVLESFLEKSEDELMNSRMKKYVASMSKLKPGTPIPDLTIKDFTNNSHYVSDLINKTSVLYFWSHTNYNHFKESHNEINKLKIKYPEVAFISINTDGYDWETVKQTLKKNNFSIQNEYIFENPEMARESLALYPLTKVIILDKDKNIVESNANIFDKYFEEELLGAINR